MGNLKLPSFRQKGGEISFLFRWYSYMRPLPYGEVMV